MSARFINESDPLPPLAETIELPKVDRSTPVVVSYGWQQDDPTTLAHLEVTRWGVFRLVPQRRKRFETWHDEDGRLMGRWEWEHVSPRLESLG